MSVNLLRNSKVYFTTNLSTSQATDGQVATSGFSTTNTWRIDVLDGFTFSQATATETITLNEAGATPTRGQRSFNTALEPAEFSFSTYIRPYYKDVGTTDTVSAPEAPLWNALFSNLALNATNSGWVETAGATPVSTIATPTVTGSNVHQLQKFGLIIVLDQVVYYIDNCAMNSATIDFGLDEIATIAWTGNGTTIRQSESLPSLVAGTNFTDVPAVTRFLANKLSTVTVNDSIGGGGTSNYTIALTGGQISINNNITYLTPAILGKVNNPVTYFTGTRAISGNMTCYLRSDSANKFSAELQQDILASSATASETKYQLVFSIGGAAASNRVDITIPAAMLSIPTVNAEQVVSLDVNFVGQGFTGENYDITKAEEIKVQYYATL